MHQLRCGDHPTAVDLPDGLVAEADAEHGHAPRRPPRGSATHMMPACSGRPGPGESRMASAPSSMASSTAERIVAVDDRLGAQLAEVLDEVEDERVVVVDHEDPGGHDRQPACRMPALSNGLAPGSQAPYAVD